MTDQHQIVPPPHLLKQWTKTAQDAQKQNGPFAKTFALAAINWAAPQIAAQAADQELEACCAWVQGYAERGDLLRAARRPKPQSLAEEALEELQVMEGAMYSADLGCDFSATRRALERLQELEGQGDG